MKELQAFKDDEKNPDVLIWFHEEIADDEARIRKSEMLEEGSGTF